MIFQDIIGFCTSRPDLKTANLHVADPRLLQKMCDLNCVDKVCEHTLWMVRV